MTNELTERARGIFDATPFSRLLGAELVAVGTDCAEIRINNRNELQQHRGFIAGGVIAYLADHALTFAGGLALGGDALTSEFKINYAKPAVGDAIVARAKALIVTRRQAVCQCSIYAIDSKAERLIVLAQGTIVAAELSSEIGGAECMSRFQLDKQARE